MLILSRKTNQKILVGDDIELTIIEIRGDQVKVGINAPSSVKVFREEIQPALKQMGIILLLGNAEKMPAKKIRKIIEREKEDSQEK